MANVSDEGHRKVTSATFIGSYWYAETTCGYCGAEIIFRYMESVGSPVAVEEACAHAKRYAPQDGNIVVEFEQVKID